VSIVHSTDNIWAWKPGGIILKGKKERNLKINLSECHFIHLKSHKNWPGASVVRGRWLTTWAMAQTQCVHNCLVLTRHWSYSSACVSGETTHFRWWLWCIGIQCHVVLQMAIHVSDKSIVLTFRKWGGGFHQNFDSRLQDYTTRRPQSTFSPQN
jgi:hypothetical protein